MPAAFYEPDGDRYVATELTRGPWDPGAQHAGPPAALLGREIERLPDAEEFQVGRVTFEILRSVPIAPVSVEAQVVRPGRRVQLVEAELSDEAGEPLMRASGLADSHRPGRSAAEALADAAAAARPRARAPKSTSSPPGRRSATTRRWSAGSSRAASSSPARRPSGCGCASRWWAARSPRRCSGCWSTADVGNGISASARLPPLPLHQRRPHRPPRADAGGRVGLRRRRHPAAAQRHRHRRVGPLRPAAAASAAPCRRSSSAER